MVKGQRGERLSNLHAARHNGHLFRVEVLGDHLLQQLGEGRRQLRRLQHRPVARREGIHQRRKGEVQRIVPGRDDPDHPQRFVPHPRLARLKVDADVPFLRLHPPGQVLLRMAHGAERRHQLHQLRLDPRARAEVAGDRVGEPVGILPNHGRYPVKTMKAKLQLGRRMVARSPMLRLERRAHRGKISSGRLPGVGVGHEQLLSRTREATPASDGKEVAERVGFEPTVRLPVRRISSAVLSTTQPPLRDEIRAVRRRAGRSVARL